jgi:hypothetical protein
MTAEAGRWSRRRWVVPLLTLGALGSGLVLPAGAADRAEGLSAALARAAGSEPVFLLMRSEADQLVARTAGGTVDREIARAAQRPLFDDRLQMVWLRSDDRLEALDLTEAIPTPRVIVKGVPPGAQVSIRWPGKNDEDAPRVVPSFGVCDPDQEVVLTAGARPEVDGPDEQAAKPTLVGATWLKARAARAPAGGGQVLWLNPPPATKSMKLPAGVGRCDDREFCGAWLPFGKRGLRLVMIEQRDVGGHCPTRSCLLYDPGTKLYATPPAAAKWGPAKQATPGQCLPYFFDRAGTHVASGDQVCQLGKGCQKVDGVVIGWLDGGVTIVPD